MPDYLFMPIDNRTTASFEGDNDYIFWAKGGLIWSAPYLAGIIALAYQIKPDITPQKIYDCLKEICSN